WWDKTIQINGIEASTVMLAIAVIVLIAGVVQSFVKDVRVAQAENRDAMGEYRSEEAAKVVRASRFQGLMASPIAVLSAIVILVSMGSMGKAFADQYPEYSVGLGNLRALGGQTCGLAADAMLETNSNESFLTPVNSPLGESLEADEVRGFSSAGIPPFISQDQASTASVGAIAVSVEDDAAGSDDASGQATG